MDKRVPEDEQGSSSDWKTMSDPPPSFKQEAQVHGPPSQNPILHEHGMASHLRNSLKLQHKPLEGTDNPAYIEHQIPLPNLSGFYYDNIKASKSHDSQRVMRNNTAAARESLPPLLILSEEIPLESVGRAPVKIANKVLGTVFAFITIPFTCLILALHHLLRFILQGVGKPLVFDTLRLIIDNTLQPFMTELVVPTFNIVRDGSASLIDIVMEYTRPITALLRSVRMAEVHFINKYSVQEV